MVVLRWLGWLGWYLDDFISFPSVVEQLFSQQFESAPDRFQCIDVVPMRTFLETLSCWGSETALSVVVVSILVGIGTNRFFYIDSEPERHLISFESIQTCLGIVSRQRDRRCPRKKQLMGEHIPKITCRCPRMP